MRQCSDCRWTGLRGLRCAPVVFFALLCCTARAQDQQVICDRGSGRFAAQIHSGAGVKVGAVRDAGFSAHACAATLQWKGQDRLSIPRAAEMDVEVAGVNLGLGVPVIAFQSRKSILEWQADYQIYSFDQSPRLLRTLTGSDSYRAVDADFDGRIAIWVHDAAAAVGFDDLNYAEFDVLPTLVLRFEHRRLIDVSCEYASHYDEQIAKLRGELDPSSLNAFKASDGKLLDGSLPPGQLLLLRKPKVKVLELVWAWLYSGREQQAWGELARDWPASDVDRARAAILAGRKKGMDTQVDEIARSGGPRHRNKPPIYETTAEISPQQQHPFNMTLDAATRVRMVPPDTQVDVAPVPILLLREEVAKSKETVELTIDAAGKVHAAKLMGNAVDPELLEAAKGWKFIPAFRGGRAVACRDLIEVSPAR